MDFLKKILLYQFLVFGFLQNSFGEGTKELMPVSTSDTRILIARGSVGGQQRDPFAVYLEDANYRLYIHISDFVNERVYFGLGQNSGAAVNWRIHKPDGSIAWPVPPAPVGQTPGTGQQGFINSYTEAFNGPSAIATGGYNALSFDPTVNGDYYMTFEISNGQSRDFRYFDITVVNKGSTPMVAIPGRVFSKCWQIRNPEPWGTNRFKGEMFIYSIDGIVTKLDPNNLEGRDFSFSSNESGCYQVNPPTMTSTEARRSQTGRHTYPQFKIFLNDPDNGAYPSGTIGELIIPPAPAQAVVTNADCASGTITFTFSVTQPGSVQIDLLLNATLGAPYVDRQIVEPVIQGQNTIIWDGMDGGTPPKPVPNNTMFNFSLTYINGMTHLPLYDAESNSGFRVYLVRPPSSNPKFYWDDVHIPGGNTNLTGCQSSPTSTCHPWGNSQGDQNSMNTWWYVSNTSTAPAMITERRTPPYLGNIVGPADVCENDTVRYRVPGHQDATTYNWTLPNGTIVTTVDTSILVDFTGLGLGAQLLRVQGVNDCGGGPKSALDINIHALPTASISGNDTVCLNSTHTYSTQPGMANYAWSVSTGGTITAGSGTNLVTVNWTSTGTKTIAVSYDDPFGCGVPTPAIENVLVNADPVPEIIGPDTVCVSSAFTYSTSGGMTGYTWSVTSGGTITSGSGSNTIQIMWNTSGTDTVSLVYTDAGGCTAPVPSKFPVVIHARPAPVIQGPTSVCQNSEVFYHTAEGMTGYTWAVSTGGVILQGAGTDSVRVKWPGTGPGTVSVNYTNSNGCTAINPVTLPVTVNPLPVPAVSGNSSVCLNSSHTYTTDLSMTNYIWNISSGGTITSGQGSSSIQVIWNAIGTGTVQWVEVGYTNGNGCVSPAPTRYYVTVNPFPNVQAAPATLTICSGTAAQVQFSSTIPGTIGNSTFTWTLTAPAAITPGLLNGTGDLNQLFTNSGIIPETVSMVVTGTTGSCSSPPQAYTFVVNPVAKAIPGSNQQLICSGSQISPVTLSSPVANSVFTWTVSCDAGIRLPCPSAGTGNSILPVQLFNDVTSPMTVVYNIASSFGGCPGEDTSHVVTVNPVADVVLTNLSETICSGTNTTSVPLNTSITGTTVSYTWTVLCSPGIITCPAGGSGNQIPSALLTSGASIYTQQQAVYTIVPSIGSCTGINKAYTVLVNPVPDVLMTPAAHPTICSGSSTDFSLSSHVSGTSFTWSSSGETNITPQVITSQTDNPVRRNFSNSGTSPENVTFSVTAMAAGCNSQPAQYLVSVNPVANVVVTPASQEICSGGSTSAVNLSTSISEAPVTYTWNSVCDAGIATCPPAAGPAAIIPPQPLNLLPSTFNQQTVTYTITPAIGNCSGTSSPHVVLVKPIPNLVVSPSSHPQICSGATTSFAFSSAVASTAFTWSAGAGASITPVIPPGQTDNPVQRTFTNSGNNIENVTFTVTASAAGCISQPSTYIVKVSPKPSVLLPANPPNPQQICSGTPLVAVPLQSSVTLPGVTYAWTAKAYDPVNPTTAITGFTTPNNGSSIPAENISSSLLTQGLILYSVVPTFTTSGVACPGDTVGYQVLVNPSPSVTLNYPDPWGQEVCSEGTSNTVRFNPTASPTTYTWQAVEVVNVTGAQLNGTIDSIPPQNVTLTGTVRGHVRYKVTPSYQGTGTFTCPGGSSYTTIFVNPLPQPAVTGASIVCELKTGEKYSTEMVVGNSYSWNITGATSIQNQNTSEVTVTWGPYTSSPGTLAVTEIINQTGCVKTSETKTVTLQQRPIPTLQGPQTFLCEGSSGHRYSTEAGKTNYQWVVTGGTITSGGGTGNDFAVVTWNQAGIAQLEVNYLNELGCPGEPPARLTLTINPLPATIITKGPGPDCEGAAHSYSVPADPLCSYTWAISPASRGTISAGQGSNTVTINWNSQGAATLSVVAVNGTTSCTQSGSLVLDVRPKPLITFTPCFDLVTTPGAKRFTLKGAYPQVGGQGVFSGTRVEHNTTTGEFEFNPFGAGSGPYPITYTFTNNYGCSASSPPVIIQVLQNPFSCGGDLTDPRDGKKYKTSVIGGRCWMAENLTYGTTIDPPYQSQLDNCINERYCGPADPGCQVNGGFYQWDELMKYGATSMNQGLCPPEWHVPSETEWQQLIDNISNNFTIPADAVAAGIFKDLTINQGFYSLMTSIYYHNYTWMFASGSLSGTFYWTSTTDAQNRSLARGINSKNPSLSRYWSARSNAFTVRCIKDFP